MDQNNLVNVCIAGAPHKRQILI